MVGNLVAEVAVRCRAEPGDLSPGEPALSRGDRLRRHDVAWRRRNKGSAPIAVPAL